MTEETLCKLTPVFVTDMDAVMELAKHLVCQAEIKFVSFRGMFGFTAEDAVHWDDPKGSVYEFLDRLRKYIPDGHHTAYVETTTTRFHDSGFDIEGFSYTVTHDSVTGVVLGQLPEDSPCTQEAPKKDESPRTNVVVAYRGLDADHVEVKVSKDGFVMTGIAVVGKEAIHFNWMSPGDDADTVRKGVELLKELEDNNVLDDDLILRAANAASRGSTPVTSSYACTNMFRVTDDVEFAVLVSRLRSENTVVERNGSLVGFRCDGTPYFDDPSLPAEAHDGATDIALFVRKLATLVSPGDDAVLTVAQHRGGHSMSVVMYVAMDGTVTKSSFGYAPCETLEPEKDTPSA